MSKIHFRNIEKIDLNQVYILLNQLKEMDITSIDKDKVWNNFINNNSSNYGIINTSFNIQGEPIVEVPRDGLRCFGGTGIDIIVIGDYVVRKTHVN